MIRRAIRIATILLAVTAPPLSGARADDGEAPAFAAYTMTPPAGWHATPILSPHIFRCVASPACAKQIVIVTSRRTKSIVSSEAQLAVLAKILALADAATATGADGKGPATPVRTGRARDLPALFTSSHDEATSRFEERVTLFPGRAAVTITSSAHDSEAARRNLDLFVAAIVLIPQP